MAPRIPEAEFQTWYTVREAVELLARAGFDKEEACRSILGGLRTGDVEAGAKRTFKEATDPTKKSEILPFAPMRFPHWALDDPAASFWENGKYDGRKDGALGFLYHHEGVRFKRAGVDKLAAEGRRAAPPVVNPTTPSGERRQRRLAPDEFVKWVTLRELLSALPIRNDETKRRSIKRRLADGLLRSSAETVVDRNGRHVRAVLPPATWADLDPHDDFWETGEFEHFTASSTGYERWVDFTCYGVKFNPDDVQSFLAAYAIRAEHSAIASPQPVGGTVARGAAERTMPKVGPAELLAWTREFGAANRDATFAIFLANARQHFRNRRVTERPMRAAIAKAGFTKTRGNPAIKRK